MNWIVGGRGSEEERRDDSKVLPRPFLKIHVLELAVAHISPVALNLLLRFEVCTCKYGVGNMSLGRYFWDVSTSSKGPLGA